MENPKPRASSGIRQAIQVFQQRLDELNRLSRNNSIQKHLGTPSRPDLTGSRKARLFPSKSKVSRQTELNSSAERDMPSSSSQKSLGTEHRQVSSLRVSVNTTVSGQSTTNAPVNIFNFNHYSIIKPSLHRRNRTTTPGGSPIYISDSGLGMESLLNASANDFLVLMKKPPEEQSPLPTLLTLEHVRDKSSSSLRLMTTSAELGRRSTVCFPEPARPGVWSALKKKQPPTDIGNPQKNEESELSGWLLDTEEHYEFITRLRKERDFRGPIHKSMASRPESKLDSTRIVVNDLKHQLEELLECMTSSKMAIASKSAQTEEPMPREWNHSNTSFLNVVRELAKLKFEQPEIRELDPSQAKNPQCRDVQKHLMFTNIVALSREQMVFEQGLLIMQEKGVNLEELFASAYEKAGVVSQADPDCPDLVSPLDASLNLSGATLITPPLSYREEPQKANQFLLDFTSFCQPERSSPN